MSDGKELTSKLRVNLHFSAKHSVLDGVVESVGPLFLFLNLSIVCDDGYCKRMSQREKLESE